MRVKCKICGKIMKGPQGAHPHLSKMHPDVVVEGQGQTWRDHTEIVIEPVKTAVPVKATPVKAVPVKAVRTNNKVAFTVLPVMVVEDDAGNRWLMEKIPDA